ncbi:hypothetical protein E2320_012314, partial [Naja naja]
MSPGGAARGRQRASPGALTQHPLPLPLLPPPPPLAAESARAAIGCCVPGPRVVPAPPPPKMATVAELKA